MSPTSGTTGTATESTTQADTTTTGTGSASSTGDESTTGVQPKLDMGVPVCPPDPQETTFDFIWIANTSQGTVSKINTLKAANCGVYSGLQAVA